MMKNDLKLNTWYKWINHYNVPTGLKYIKIVELNDNLTRAYYSERISVSGEYIKKRDYFDGLSNLVQINVSEIQDYLPVRHKDLLSIKKQLFPIW